MRYIVRIYPHPTIRGQKKYQESQSKNGGRMVVGDHPYKLPRMVSGELFSGSEFYILLKI
eukprot:1380005-Amorphochlora_amoeboformis.AAC.1